MFIERQSVSVTTGTGGTATGYTARPVNGRLLGIHYIPDGSTPFATTVGVTITTEDTGVTILAETGYNAAANRFPRQQIHSTTGGVITSATGATNEYAEPLAIANERIKIAIASGGATKTGRFDVVIG